MTRATVEIDALQIGTLIDSAPYVARLPALDVCTAAKFEAAVAGIYERLSPGHGPVTHGVSVLLVSRRAWVWLMGVLASRGHMVPLTRALAEDYRLSVVIDHRLGDGHVVLGCDPLRGCVWRLDFGGTP